MGLITGMLIGPMVTPHHNSPCTNQAIQVVSPPERAPIQQVQRASDAPDVVIAIGVIILLCVMIPLGLALLFSIRKTTTFED